MELIKKIGRAFRFLFGTIIYQPPGFIPPLRQKLKKTYQDAVRGFRKIKTGHPGVYKGLKIIILVLLILFMGYKIWQSTIPEPKKLRVMLEAPGPMPLVKETRPNPLIIDFTGSAARLEDVQKEITAGIEINPATTGQWKWTSDDRIRFMPEKDWKAGTEYSVKMSKKLFPPHILLEAYEETFTTTPFKVAISSAEFYVDPVNEDLKQIAATVDFSHPVDPESFKSRVTLRPFKLDEDIRTFEDRDYQIDITYDEFLGKAYIISEALPMPADDVQMELTIKKGVACTSEGSRSLKPVSSWVTVPGISSFIRINSVSQTMVRNDSYQLEQVLVIESKGKARSEDLEKDMEVWLLPRDKPETPGSKARPLYSWSDPAMVGPEVIERSTRISLQPIETEHEYESLNTFKIVADPEKYLYVRIKKGTPFYGKYTLAKDYDTILRVKSYPKQLEIMHEGIILSSTGRKKVSLMSQGIDQVQFRIGRVQPDQLNHLVSQSNGDLTNVRFRNYLFSEENIVENYYETETLKAGHPGEANYFSFDFSNYLQPKAMGKVRNGIFFFEVMEWDQQRNRPGSLRDKRLIMISDLGVLVKDGRDDSHDLFVQSISTGLPVANARVQVLGKNGIPILAKATDSEGHVPFPSLKSSGPEKTPTVYVIGKGEDLTFMPVNAPGRWLNYSRFDAAGVHGATDPNKIDGMLFSDRGLYRPGDEFNIGIIVKAGDWAKSLSGTPLEAAVIDARGIEIFKKKFKLSASGFEELKYQTEDTSPTGTYQINLYTIRKDRRHNHIASTTIQIEEFLPDRLTITSVFPNASDMAWVSPDSLKAVVTLRNLFGSPARGNRIVPEMSLSPGRMWFRPYRDYAFSDPLTTDKSFHETLPESKTDDLGKAVFDFNLSRFEPATFTLTFSADGFEKQGGRNVSTVSQILVSPLKYLLGTKVDGDLSYIHRDSERTLKVIAIDPGLKKVDVPDIQFVLNRIQHVSVLTKRPNGTYAYKSVQKRVPVNSTAHHITAEGFNFSLPTHEPGEYELNIKNSDDVQFSRIPFTVVGMENLTRSLDQTAELEIKLNKTDYEPGEEIEIYVKAPYKGAGLITIERDKIYSSQWFKSNTSSFIKTIRLPADLEGNGYVNVSFVRAADSKEIFMSPLSYGIAPFSVSKKNRMNPISIDVPDLARSGEVYPIKYKTAKSAKMLVFAVDEGILQVAGYTTPDPLGHFFKKRALEVKTSQLLDLILPEFNLFQLNAAMGGGVDFADEIAKNLNPFKRKRQKPVVFWSGILDSDQKERTLEYNVPDYFNGTLRVMAFAVSQDAIGTFEEKAIVRNPYIISPNVPMFTAPDDSFLVTVTVTNSVSGSGKKSPVELSVLSSSHLDVYYPIRKLVINEDADTTLTFHVKVNDVPGGAALNFQASGEKETTKLAAYLSVRPAVPYQTRVTTGILQDEKAQVATPRQLYADFRVLDASVSFLPLGLSKGLVAYLDRFPYGCTEQVVSQAFPYLYLRNVSGFGIEDDQAGEKIKYALKVLQARQNEEGKFGIWAANSYTSDFITVYGMHFITECRNAGTYVAENLYVNAISALKQIAAEKRKSPNDLRIQAYAIYLLTRNEQITTNYIASLREILDEEYKGWEKDLTGAYLAASYQLMKQDSEANKIFRKMPEQSMEKIMVWHFYNPFIQNAQLLYLLSRHAPDELEDVSTELIRALAFFLKNGDYNTITSSYAVMALHAYSEAAGEPAGGRVAVQQILQDNTKKDIPLPSGKFPSVAFSEQAQKLRIESDGELPLYYQVVQGGFDTTLPKDRVSEGVELFREYTDKNGDLVNKVKIGDEVEVHLKFRSLDDIRLPNIAIVDLLPAGLEAVPTSLRENIGGSWRPDHTDIREDRLVIYGTVSPDVQEFIYTVRAINKGRFIVPPIYGESMYDRSIYGYSPQEPLIVE